MTYYLYIDVIFFTNFIMNIVIIHILKHILKLQSSISKIIISGMIGAVWACLLVCVPVLPHLLEGIITYTLISALMVKIAFSPKTLKALVSAVIGLYLSAVMLGGIVFGLYQYTRTGEYIELLLNGEVFQSIPLFIVLLLAAGAAWFCIFIWKTVLSYYKHKKNLFQVTLCYRGKYIRTVGLMDTGNRLYEPVSHKPVSIMTEQVCRQLCTTVQSVCYVPYQSVGTKSGLLPAIYLDEMTLEQDGVKQEIKKPLVAIYCQTLSPGGEYQILLHQEITHI